MEAKDDSAVKVGGISTTEAAKYRSLFKLIANNNGSDGDTITEKDLADIMPRMGVFLSEDELHKLFSQIDVDGSGDIDFNEFLLLIARHREASQLALLQGGRACFEALKGSTKLTEVWRTDDWINITGDVLVVGMILFYYVTVLFEDVRQGDIAGAIYWKCFAAALMLLDIWRQMKTTVCVSTELPLDDAGSARSAYWASRRFKVDMIAALPLDVAFHLAGMKTVMRAFQHLRLAKFLAIPTLFRRSPTELVTPIYAKWHFFLLPLLKMGFLAIMIFHALTLVWILLVEVDYEVPAAPANATDEAANATEMITATVTAVWNGGGNDTNGTASATFPEERVRRHITYVDALYFVVFTLTTCGYTGETVHTHSQRVYCVFLFCCASVVTGLVVGKLVQFSQQADLQSDAHRVMLETLAALNHLNIPNDFKEEVLGFQLHRLKHSNSLFDASIADLPQCMRDRMMLYAHMKIVRQVPIFSEASDICVAKLAQSLNTIFAPPEEYIVIAGEEGEEMYFLFHGMCCVTLPNGKWVATIKRGGVFGEVALLEATRRSASIKSLTYCQLFWLDKASFEQIVEVFPDLLDAIKSVSVALRARIDNKDKDKDKGDSGGAGTASGIEAAPTMQRGASTLRKDTKDNADQEVSKRNRYEAFNNGERSGVPNIGHDALESSGTGLLMSLAATQSTGLTLAVSGQEQAVPMPDGNVPLGLEPTGEPMLLASSARAPSEFGQFGGSHSTGENSLMRESSSCIGRLGARRVSAGGSSVHSFAPSMSGISSVPAHMRSRGLRGRQRVSLPYADNFVPPFPPAKMTQLEQRIDRIQYLLDLIAIDEESIFCKSLLGLAGAGVRDVLDAR